MLDMEIDVVLSGSVLKYKHSLMRDKISEIIKAACPHAEIRDAEYEPVVGAAIMALERNIGHELNADIWDNIDKSCKTFGLDREKNHGY
jgi:hypothetical protein